MTVPLTPLTDEQLEAVLRFAVEMVGEPTISIEDLIADARWHRVELAQARAENERLQRANRTRQDYPFRCDACGRAHILDTSIPSEFWNKIAPDGGMLCTTCIDDRLALAGLRCEAEFYFVGKALKSKSYANSHGDLAEARA